MKHTLVLIVLVLGACGKSNSGDGGAGATEEAHIERAVDANCGLIDECDGVDVLSKDKEFKCKREKVSPAGWLNPWHGVDFGANACYTTYRLQQKEPGCDVKSPHHQCAGPFGQSVPCCPYFDIPGKSLDDILPIKQGCASPSSC